MFEQSFHQLIRYRREKLKLRQTQVAKELDFTRTRLSQLERGVRGPTEDEKVRLFRFYRVHRSNNCPSRPPKALRSLLDMGRRAIPSPPVYLPPRDRVARIRYLAATRRWPTLTSKLTKLIRSRKDYTLLMYFCQNLALDSAEECLYLMLRLAEGAQPALLAPMSLAPTPHPVICPKSGDLVGHRPRPCLICKDRVEFPQVSFLTPRIYTVDSLVFAKRWEMLEVDGIGHSPHNDVERAAALGLPTTRLNTENLVNWAYELGELKVA